MKEKEKAPGKYQETILNDLALKVKQLQKANRLLRERTDKLKDYSRKLETLLHIIINLQMAESPRDLRDRLVREICAKLGFDRCAFLEADYEKMLLKVTAARGFQKKEWESVRIHYDLPVFQRLFPKSQVLFFSSPDNIPDQQSKNILRQVNAQQFLFGILGTPIPGVEQLSLEEHLRDDLLSNLIPHLYGYKNADIEMIREHLREYLSSDILYFGGYVFIDYKNPAQRFSRYDIKLLEMLLRTASLLYQNLRMREQLKEFFIRAEKEAITDHLTDLYNYRYFTHQLSREFNRAQRHHSRFALLMLDIDFFKDYNDTFGHQAGDIVLKKVAQTLQNNTRASDFVARYGGEEFVIICPELDKEGGKQIAVKLCRIIANTPFPREEQLPHKKVTISIGVAAYPADAASPEELIRRVDIALYQAKNQGRNRVQLFEKNL